MKANRFPWLAALLGLLALGGGGVLLQQRLTTPKIESSPRSEESVPPTLAKPQALAPHREKTSKAKHVETESVLGAQVEQPAEHLHEHGLERPHPITKQHQHMAEQHSLFGEVSDALERRDFQRARELLQRHAERFPQDEDWLDMRIGYEAMADCLEQPGAESRARGERFIEEYAASPVRRHVRRACLGPRPMTVRKVATE